MREFRPYGSVRGVLGNRHPYRDHRGRDSHSMQNWTNETICIGIKGVGAWRTACASTLAAFAAGG